MVVKAMTGRIDRLKHVIPCCKSCSIRHLFVSDGHSASAIGQYGNAQLLAQDCGTAHMVGMSMSDENAANATELVPGAHDCREMVRVLIGRIDHQRALNASSQDNRVGAGSSHNRGI